MSLLHRAASLVWSSVNRVAREVSSRRRKFRYPFRVVVVGNIEAGGTGKTPITAELARRALEKKRCVVILTRGYRGKAESQGRILRPGESASPEEIGDESALLRKLVPEAWIGIGADRETQLTRILERMKTEGGKSPDLVLLDDGLQQFWVEPTERVICLSGKNWGEDAYFRERFSEIREDDTVILTKGNSFPASLRSNLKRVRVEWVIPGPAADTTSFLLVHGVGRPETVRPTFERAGWKISAEKVFPDHASYELDDVNQLIEAAKNSRSRVVTTGKDAVKWQALGVADADYLVIEPTVKVTDGADTWNALIDRL